MKYRCVINNDNEVIAIGLDEDQSGKDYNKLGTWSDFIFENIPEEPIGFFEFQKSNPRFNLLKVIDKNLITKTLIELNTEKELKEIG